VCEMSDGERKGGMRQMIDGQMKACDSASARVLAVVLS